MYCVRNIVRRGRLCVCGGGGYVWWQNLNIRMVSGLLDDRWLVDNISRQVGDVTSSLFWKDPWLDGVSLHVRYARLFDLAVNKFATVGEMIKVLI